MSADQSPELFPSFQPAPNAQRDSALDLLRGFAVFGILLINMYSFALPEAMRFNPQLLSFPSGLDSGLWYLLNFFCDGKFIALLSLAFGASLWLFAEDKESVGLQWLDNLQRRRGVSLLVLGALHSYLVWDGDVLFSYAVYSFFAWHWRHFSDRRLLSLALLLIVLQGLPLLVTQLLPDDIWAEMMKDYSADAIKADMVFYQQGWWAQAPVRIGNSITLQLAVIFDGWYLLAAMLVGIVLVRRGYLGGQEPVAALLPVAERRLLFFTLVLGALFTALGIWGSVEQDFAVKFIFTIGMEVHLWGSLLMAIGYALLIVRWYRAAIAGSVQRGLIAVGRMALSIYIMQSLICTSLFYGYGAGWYGQLSLSQLMLVVVLIWWLQWVFAYYWLKYCYFGPLEWVWRRLVYQQPQVLRRMPHSISI